MHHKETIKDYLIQLFACFITTANIRHSARTWDSSIIIRHSARSAFEPPPLNVRPGNLSLVATECVD